MTPAYDFRKGKIWPNGRPGPSVEVDAGKMTKIGEYNTHRAGMPLNLRPDGACTQW